MQVTLHTHLHNLLSVGENSSLTVESNVDPFYQVVPNTVFDDSTGNVWMVFTSSAEQAASKANIKSSCS